MEKNVDKKGVYCFDTLFSLFGCFSDNILTKDIKENWFKTNLKLRLLYRTTWFINKLVKKDEMLSFLKIVNISFKILQNPVLLGYLWHTFSLLYIYSINIRKKESISIFRWQILRRRLAVFSKVFIRSSQHHIFNKCFK